ncbi:hypothetical protein SK128_021391 [Halocaridina rubra]|uniref:Uncharacterized protein n=1 Tax=Halocaridina rubra TaxID=373956 RepID=A0AAN8WML2_HALRR
MPFRTLSHPYETFTVARHHRCTNIPSSRFPKNFSYTNFILLKNKIGKYHYHSIDKGCTGQLLSSVRNFSKSIGFGGDAVKRSFKGGDGFPDGFHRNKVT